MVPAALRKAAHKIETIAYRDIARAIRESADDDRAYDEALSVFRAHVKPMSVRAYRHGHTATQAATALRLAADEHEARELASDQTEEA